jgi:C4-type Zn-finger protein
LTDKEYVACPQCPECRALDMEWTPDISFQGSLIDQTVICDGCGARHKAIYTLTGYEKGE